MILGSNSKSHTRIIKLPHKESTIEGINRRLYHKRIDSSEVNQGSPTLKNNIKNHTF
jgi:hypothetical protein